MRFLNPEWVVSEYQAGRSVADLAHQSGATTEDVREKLRDAGVPVRADVVAQRVHSGEWAALRVKAEAARDQLATGKKEWPGRPSAPRLQLFLEASPDNVLALLDDLEALAQEFPRACT